MIRTALAIAALILSAATASAYEVTVNDWHADSYGSVIEETTVSIDDQQGHVIRWGGATTSAQAASFLNQIGVGASANGSNLTIRVPQGSSMSWNSKRGGSTVADPNLGGRFTTATTCSNGACTENPSAGVLQDMLAKIQFGKIVAAILYIASGLILVIVALESFAWVLSAIQGRPHTPIFVHAVRAVRIGQERVERKERDKEHRARQERNAVRAERRKEERNADRIANERTARRLDADNVYARYKNRARENYDRAAKKQFWRDESDAIADEMDRDLERSQPRSSGRKGFNSGRSITSTNLDD